MLAMMSSGWVPYPRKGIALASHEESGKLKGILESQSSRKIYRKLKQVGNLKEEKKIF